MIALSVSAKTYRRPRVVCTRSFDVLDLSVLVLATVSNTDDHDGML